MTTYLGKSCSFCLPRVPFVNCRQFMYLVISLLVFLFRPDMTEKLLTGTLNLNTTNQPFGFEGRIWDLIVSVPDHCLSFYFT